MIGTNRDRYLRSLSAELAAQATRVRDLIGEAHWLSDGHHKEYLLQHLLSRHVPHGILVSRGFVIHPLRPDLVSREQDLLFVDTTGAAPILDQGGLCIALPGSIAAAVAVKTTCTHKELTNAIATLASVRKVSAYVGGTTRPWCGVIFFAPCDAKVLAKIPDWLFDLATDREIVEAGSIAVPDVVAIVDTAGFVIEQAEADSSRLSIRGFTGDGVVLMLSSLLRSLGYHRGMQTNELEDFFGGCSLAPMSGSPFSQP